MINDILLLFLSSFSHLSFLSSFLSFFLSSFLPFFFILLFFLPSFLPFFFILTYSLILSLYFSIFSIYLLHYFIRCWTKGKKEKLEYLKKTKMWYLSPTCSDHANLKPSGTVFGQISEKESHDMDKRWDHLSELCCTVMDGAPY